MKNSIVYFILGFAIAISLPFNSDIQRMVFTPDRPVNTYTIICTNQEAKVIIRNLSTQGYIFKYYNGVGNGTGSNGLLVMEKY